MYDPTHTEKQLLKMALFWRAESMGRRASNSTRDIRTYLYLLYLRLTLLYMGRASA